MKPLFHIPSGFSTSVAFVALCTLLTLTAFWGVSDNFFEIDDVRFLYDARQTLADPASFFSPTKSLPGRPVTELAFVVLLPFGQRNPAFYHWALITAHLIAGLLAAFVFQRLGYDRELSFTAALFFLLNVAHVRAVQWISCLAYPLALIFALAAWLVFQTYLKTAKKQWQWITVGLLLLAGLSHPAAFALSAFCAYLAYQHTGRLSCTLAAVWPLFATAGLCAALLFVAFPHMPQAYIAQTHSQTNPLDLVQKFLLFFGALFTRAFWLPAEMGMRTLDVVAGGALALSGVVAIYKKVALPATGAAFIACLLLPFGNVPDEHTYSRYLYLASAGSSLVLAWALRRAIYLLPGYHKAVWTGALVLITLSAALSLQRAEALSLASSGLYSFVQMGQTDDPDLQNALRQMGRDDFIQAMARDNRYLPAVALRALEFGQTFPDQINQALSTDPNNDKLQILNAIYKAHQGHLETAQQQIKKIARTNHHQFASRAWHNQGRSFLHTGRYQEARLCYTEAIEYNPHDPDILIGLAQSQTALNNLLQAEACYRKAMAQFPHHHEAYIRLTGLLISQNRPHEALNLHIPAGVLRHPWMQFYKGLAHARIGDRRQARAAFEKALRYGPHENHLPERIAQIYQQWEQNSTNHNP